QREPGPLAQRSRGAPVRSAGARRARTLPVPAPRAPPSPERARPRPGPVVRRAAPARALRHPRPRLPMVLRVLLRLATLVGALRAGGSGPVVRRGGGRSGAREPAGPRGGPGGVDRAGPPRAAAAGHHLRLVAARTARAG